MFLLILLFFLASLNGVLSNFYGSLSGYACNNPQLYNSCGCPSFCQYYNNFNGNGCYHDNNNCHQRKMRKKHKKKKFKFSSEDDISFESAQSAQESKNLNDDDLPPPPFSEEKKSRKNKVWEDEKEWDHKFMSKTPPPQQASTAPKNMGLGNGQLFNIGSGVGVGVPGVGPIGISSGIGVG